MNNEDPLNYFGRFVSEKLRDPGHRHVERLLRSEWKAPSLQPLIEGLAQLSPAQRDLVRRVVASAVDSAIHDFLFALQEDADSDAPRIRVLVDDVEVAKQSDGLHGEPFSDTGWYARFSTYGESGLG